MLRKLALSLAVAGAIGATNANALGLGEIRVNSALNEPLKAEIKLLQVRDLSPMQIRPRMADVDEFSLAGMSKSRFLTDVSFQVKVLPDGSGVIQMSSTAPIKEPFLNFLVEVNWPSGRLVREYTLLLDPPVFDPAPVPGVVAPAKATAKPAAPAAKQPPQPKVAATAPASSAKPKPAQKVSNIRTRVDPATEFYVDVHDTLWKLAMEHRPDNSVSGEQMMLALLKKNPQAFPTSNINVLKAGMVMKVPTLEEIRQLSRQQAVAEVARQTQLWKQGRMQPASTPAPAPTEPAVSTEASKPEGKSSESASEPSGEADSQLKIVTPKDKPVAVDTPALEQSVTDAAAKEAASAEPAADSASTDGTDSAQMPAETADAQELVQRNEDLENRLLMTQETVDKVERENAELNGKLDSIVSQLDKMTRLMELRDQELAAMQQRLQQAQAESAAGGPGLVNDLTRNPGLLAGLGGAVVALLAGAWLLLRRGRGNNGAAAESKTESADATLGVAAAGAAAAAVAAQADAPVSAEAEADVALAEAPIEDAAASDEDLDDDLQGLDLDMDLELDEHGSMAEPIGAEEFDLGVDDLAEEEPGETIDNALDDLLSASAATAEEEPEEAEIVAEQPSVAAEADDVLELPDELEFNVEKPVETDVVEAEEDELSGLDFAVDLSASTADVDKDSGDEMLEGFFDEDVAKSEDSFAPLADSGEIEPLTDEALEFDNQSSTLDTVAASAEPEEFEVDQDLEAMLQASSAEADEEEATAEPEHAESAVEDLDALLASFEPDELDESMKAEPAQSEPAAELDLEQELDSALSFDDDLSVTPGEEPSVSEQAEEELTANIAHDLELDLDSELDELLGSTDEEIALDEERSEVAEEEVDAMNLLDGADEVETKLDLARAYIEMDDTDGARDILNEIVAEGNHFQRREAQKLLEELS